MSSYNKMIQSSFAGYGSRDALSRETYAPPYFSGRREIEMNDSALWRQALRIMRRHWKASLAFALILELALAFLVFSMDNTYNARAVLDVEPPGADTVGLHDASANPANTPGYLETQTEILNSDGLALSVVDQLHLDQDPTFMKQGLIQQATAWVVGWFSSPNKNGLPRDTDKMLTIFHRNMSVGQVKGSQLVEVQYQS